MLFATTLTRYARGVPLLYVFLLFPVMVFVIYQTYPLSPPSSSLGVVPFTVLPLALLLLAAAFVRFNQRLVSTIHLLPHRRLSLRTINMLRSSDPVVLPLDALIPPFAYSGAADKSLERLRFVRDDGGVTTFFIYPMPNRAEDADAELLTRILTHNRLDNAALRA